MPVSSGDGTSSVYTKLNAIANGGSISNAIGSSTGGGYSLSNAPQAFPDLSSFQWNGSIQNNLMTTCVKNYNPNMNTKYYKVLKETPAWKAGAIVEGCGGNNGYRVVNDLWLQDAAEGIEYYETKHIVENSPEFFERVYRVSKEKKSVYTTKEEAQKIISDEQTA